MDRGNRLDLLQLHQQENADDRPEADHGRCDRQTKVQATHSLGRRRRSVRGGTRGGSARGTRSRGTGGSRWARHRCGRCSRRRRAQWRRRRSRGRSQRFGRRGRRRRRTGRGRRGSSRNRRQLDGGGRRRFRGEADADRLFLGLDLGGVARPRRDSAWRWCRGSATWSIRIVLGHKLSWFC